MLQANSDPANLIGNQLHAKLNGIQHNNFKEIMGGVFELNPLIITKRFSKFKL